MQYQAIYFQPQGRLATPITSDLLFGAVCWAMRLLDIEDVGAMLGAFAPPRFAFSGLFPCFGTGSSALRFYPRPLSFALGRAQVGALQTDKKALTRLIEAAKSFNKVSHLSEHLMKQVLSGTLSASEMLRCSQLKDNDPNAIEPAGSALVTVAERKLVSGKQPLHAPMVEVVAQRNQIDRVAGATAGSLLFYEREYDFAPKAGLWGLVAVQDEATWQKVQAALRYLADTGLGANRSTGKGHFDITWAAITTLPQATAKANALVTLSHYLPTKGEVDVSRGPLAYQLTTVWAKREKRFAHLSPEQSAPTYKRRVRMMQPGAVLPLPAKELPIYGRLARVAEPMGADGWTTYQSGLMLALKGVL